MRQTFARVNLAAYRKNLRAIRAGIGQGSRLMAVVKADAYGHGLVPVAEAAQEEKADFLGVALAEEGIALREAGIRLPVLVLAGLSQDSAASAIEHDLTLTVHTKEHVRAAQTAAKSLGKRADVHIKIDTGMNRIGVKTDDELRQVLSGIEEADAVRLCGAFTHFASADRLDSDMTDRQLERFEIMRALLPKGLLLHASGSSALLTRPDARFQMVRAGISTYGYSPVPSPVNLEPVLSWYAEITHVKEIAPGETVSYGATMTALEATRVATLAVGYGDGYNRLLSNKAAVLVNGARCPVLGRVCMDQVMVDVTRAGQVLAGSQAVLLGRDGEEFIGADELAGLIGTISYEVLLSISKRVPRVYANG